MAIIKGLVHDGYVQVRRKVRFMEDVQTYSDNLLGDTFYVRDNGSDSANGKTVGEAFKTLSYAIHHAAGDWDKIVVLPHTTCAAYLVEAVQTVDDANIPMVITQTGLKILGYAPHAHTLGSPTIHTHVAGVNIFTINVGQVEIAGMNIQAQAADTQGVLIGSTATTPRTYIHDCSLYGVADTYGNYGINAFTFDCSQTVIERCFFNMWDVAAIRMWGGQGTLIKDNVFQVSTGAKGIIWSNATDERPFGYILDNRFITIDATNAVGISIVPPTDGYLMVDNNSFMGFHGTDGCISSLAIGICGRNYLDGAIITNT